MMNPFGRPVPLGGVNGNQLDEEKPHVTAIIHGTWRVVYSWPPRPQLTDHPSLITFERPSKLEAVLFGCRCRVEVADKLHPVKVYTEKTEVQACELVDQESHVADALSRTTCECRPAPLGEKFVALPINENILLHYQRHAGVVYSRLQPNTCLLLFKDLPSSLEIEAAVEGMDVERRRGAVTFKIKQE